MNIRELLERARVRSGLNSKRQVAIEVGIAASIMTQYERGVFIPTDEILCDFCALAEVDPKRWLLWARMQREQGKARQHWEEIAAMYVKETGPQAA
ncbi:hypothetical protein ACQU0X_27910 [Pseudovibrio ascidiaceicola]|uniref:hypothetical protein n=1 Tax=Pseudovibrio ascidiaceicola TaxID=285279 RepID=UPI003D3698A3